MTDSFTWFDPQLRKKIKQKKLAAIIPVGSIEQHGSHLPITTDSEIVTRVANKVGKKIGALVLPTITYGVSFEHAPLFQLSVRDITLQKQIIDICESLESNGIKNIFVINGHHGNQKATSQISKKVSGGKIHVFSYWHFMKRRFDHAGHVETSLMLAVSKNVKMRLAKKGLDEDRLGPMELKKARKLASKSFPKVTKNGIWGDPRRATKKEGVKILSEIIKNLSKTCQTCLTEQKTKLHQ